MSVTLQKLTLDEYLTYNDGYELVDGKLVSMSLEGDTELLFVT